MSGDAASGHVVRAATPTDVEEIAAIWRLGWRDAHLGHVPDELVVARTPESFLSRAAQNLTQTAVADAGAIVIGFVTTAGDELEQLYLAKEQRGRGVARALLREGEHRIAALGHHRAWLAVVAGNTRARSFYARCGWNDDGLFLHDAPGGITVSAHRYTRTLDQAPR